MPRSIYLDNAAAAPPSEKSVAAMAPYWSSYWGSPSAPHDKGQALCPRLHESYALLYDYLGAHEADRLVFTSSGAEAVNQAIFSVYREVTLSTGKNHFLASLVGEAPSIMGMSRLEPLGCVAKTVEVDHNGEVTRETLIDALSPRTALLSLSWVNGLTGGVQSLEEILSLCRERGVYLHVDITHGWGKLAFDLTELGIDYITCQGEPIHAPLGSGFLLARRGVPCVPLIAGGSDQGGLRAGG